MKRKSVYLLSAISPRTDSPENGSYSTDESGNFHCYVTQVGVFSSIEKAESAIKTLVESNAEMNKKYDGWEKYFGFAIDERYVDDAMFGTNISEFESMRTYDCDGVLNCNSDLDYRCVKKFEGRDSLNPNIKVGDIALEWSGYDKLHPILIGTLPLTKEEWKSRFKEGVCGDMSDDCYVAITQHGHSHPFTPNVFPLNCLPYVKIDKDILKKMKKEWKKYYGAEFKNENNNV